MVLFDNESKRISCLSKCPDIPGRRGVMADTDLYSQQIVPSLVMGGAVVIISINFTFEECAACD